MVKKAIVLIILLYLILDCLFIEPNSLKVTKYKIQNSALAGVKVAFLTDFHLKKNDSHDYKRLNKIVKLTQKQKPDLILLGGDYLQSKKYDEDDFSTVSSLATKFSLIGVPVFAVLGEADWQLDGMQITRTLHKYGVSVLANSSQMIKLNKRYVSVVGIEDIKTRQPKIDKALYRTQRLRIVVTHNPDIYYEVIDDVAVILAGHTHGGQFTIPFTPNLFVDSKFGAKFAHGLINETSNKMIISKGLGTTGIPIRFNCKPEIIIVEFTY